MKKTYKRMPRNLALTNKIINGLIEGKIVSDENGIVYIELPEEATNHGHYYDMVKDEITDEEVEKMQEELNHLRKALSTNKFDDAHGDILTAYGLLVLDYDKRGSYLQDLEKELVKYRNPWISVKDRLPEKDGDNISIPVAAITNKGYWFKGQYDYDNKDWFFSEDPDQLDFETDEIVTHWMPVPKLKKEE